MSSFSGSSSPAVSEAALSAFLGTLSRGTVMSGLSELDGVDQDGLAHLVRLASGGHSPSARLLVNASDLVTSVALATPGHAPRSELRARILAEASARAAPTATPSNPSDHEPALLPPQEALAALHMALPEDAERRRIVDALGAAGGVGHEDVDLALRSLLERLAPFMDYEVVVVSIVRGADTYHRVHRGFPAELGNVDIVPRAVSYCTHCVSADAPLLVHDGAAEAFFRQGVMVQKMGARTYLGIPIRAGALRMPIGALCCIGSRPRTIGAAEVAFVEVFADEARAILNKDAVRLGEIFAGPSVYREDWFRRILAREVDRYQALRSAAASDGDGRELRAPVLVLSPSMGAAVPQEGAATSTTARVESTLGDGRQVVLFAGGFRPSNGRPTDGGAGADGRIGRSALRAAYGIADEPNTLVAVLDASMRSVEEWIASAC